jgi:NAD(P)H-dependent flavin oxidoreductase YrpB (nitropropane dioxygenase family)
MAIVTRVTELFSCRHPLQQAGMGGVATADLALAVAGAGGIGMLAGNAPLAVLTPLLDQVPAGAAVGVNLLVPFLDPAALAEIATRTRYVELFWGEPDAALVRTIHDGGALAGWQVGSLGEAIRAAHAGCDVVVVQGVAAGGHVRGTTELLPLLAEVRPEVDLPLIAGGGIGTGAAMAEALAAGADAVRVGTRFLAANESTAHPAYVDALIAAGADDTVLTTAFGDGWPDAPHRVLRSAVEAGEARGDAQRWSPLWPTTTTDGPVDSMALYAGRSVAAVRTRQPAAQIVTDLVEAAEPLLTP